MKVFLSWSGESSHRVATALKEWLPSVIQILQPYLSSEDIDKGARWSVDIASELQASSYGIVCVTSENVQAPWIMFEAGALSKSLDKGRVAPFLFGIKRSEIQGPLLQFQSVLYSKDDVARLVQSLNGALGEEALSDDGLAKAFEVWWPILEKQLNLVASIKPLPVTAPASPGPNQILEEILELARSSQKLLRDPNELLPRGYLNAVLRESRVLSRTHGLTEDHPVWRDLRESIAELESKIEKVPAQDAKEFGSWLSDLKELANRLRGITTYIRHRVGDGPKRQSSLKWEKSEDDTTK